MIFIILPCFVPCVYLFPFFHSCSLGNWSLGCWVGTPISKNWTELNWIICIQQKFEALCVIAFSPYPLQLCLCLRVVRPYVRGNTTLVHCSFSFSFSCSWFQILSFSFGNCWSPSSCSVYRRLFNVCSSSKNFFLLDAFQLLMLFAGTLTCYNQNRFS
jgi:hypothetical protein